TAQGAPTLQTIDATRRTPFFSLPTLHRGKSRHYPPLQCYSFVTAGTSWTPPLRERLRSQLRVVSQLYRPFASCRGCCEAGAREVFCTRRPSASRRKSPA